VTFRRCWTVAAPGELRAGAPGVCLVLRYRAARWRCNSNGTISAGADARAVRTPDVGIVVTGGSEGIDEGARTAFLAAAGCVGAERMLGLGLGIVLTGATDGCCDRAAATSFAGVGISDAIWLLTQRTVPVIGASATARALGLGASIGGAAERGADGGRTRGFGGVGSPDSARALVAGAAFSDVDAGGNEVREALARAGGCIASTRTLDLALGGGGGDGRSEA
jgi:hypothetical protein